MAKGNPDELAVLLQRLNAVLNGREARGSLALLQETGLSLPHVVALYALDAKGPLSISALAAGVRLSLAATSQLVDRLVEKRFVARAESRADRRVKTVRLTASGRRTLRSIHRTRSRELAAALGRVPRATREALARALVAALGHLEA
ncbi:MAG TPA: MarR family transcriptional regulator [Myxococcales bacterium]|nr:MarR family transcriptional regulator [Myxococcales bacterium]